MSLLEYSGNESVFNIGTGIGTQLNELVDIMSEIIDKFTDVRYVSERKVDVPYNVLNVERLYLETGWSPKIGLNEGITNYIKEGHYYV